MKPRRFSFSISFHSLLGIIALLLLVVVFHLIHSIATDVYLVSRESFVLEEKYDGTTSHSVDLPIIASPAAQSCRNMCGPTAKCAITGQQCSTDKDCPGCQPILPAQQVKPLFPLANVVGDDDAGKLTVGMTPTYSVLTSGYGTHMATMNANAVPTHPSLGVDVWTQPFLETQALFDRRYKPDTSKLWYAPHYPHRRSMTDTFVEEGPLPANV